jgi:DNA polymerase-3 subunit gamma/tau
VAAAGGLHKIFIIDEVHMLSKSAFNALLKTLEEPPSHVVFVLATTEPHKILPTVLSRVQRFDFKRLTPTQIFGKLKEVAKTEKIEIEDEGLKAIAIASDGALRDAEVSLSKFRSYQGKISVDDVTNALGLVSFKYHPEFFGYLVANDKVSALRFIQKIHESGVDLENFTKDFIEYLRKVLMFKINPAILTIVGEEPVSNWQVDGAKMIRMINIFTSARTEIKTSPVASLPLELAVLELISGD